MGPGAGQNHRGKWAGWGGAGQGGEGRGALPLHDVYSCVVFNCRTQQRIVRLVIREKLEFKYQNIR